MFGHTTNNPLGRSSIYSGVKDMFKQILRDMHDQQPKYMQSISSAGFSSIPSLNHRCLFLRPCAAARSPLPAPPPSRLRLPAPAPPPSRRGQPPRRSPAGAPLPRARPPLVDALLRRPAGAPPPPPAAGAGEEYIVGPSWALKVGGLIGRCIGSPSRPASPHQLTRAFLKKKKKISL